MPQAREAIANGTVEILTEIPTRPQTFREATAAAAIKDLGDFRKGVRSMDVYKEALAEKGIVILGGKRGRTGFLKMIV